MTQDGQHCAGEKIYKQELLGKDNGFTTFVKQKKCKVKQKGRSELVGAALALSLSVAGTA